MKAHRLLAVLALALYGVSMILPTFSVFLGSAEPGYRAFRVGWSSLVTPVPEDWEWWSVSVSFLANPATWIAIAALFSGHWTIGHIASVVSVLFTLAVLPSYGGNLVCYPGYWFWLAAPMLLSLAGTVRLFRNLLPDKDDDD